MAQKDYPLILKTWLCVLNCASYIGIITVVLLFMLVGLLGTIFSAKILHALVSLSLVDVMQYCLSVAVNQMPTNEAENSSVVITMKNPGFNR